MGRVYYAYFAYMWPAQEDERQGHHMADKFYTIKTAAELLDVHPDTIRRAIYTGRLDYVRVGRVIRIPADSLQAAYPLHNTQADGRVAA